MDINKIFKRFDINTYYSNDVNINNIDDFFNEIHNNGTWNKYLTKQYLNKLYNYKRLAIKNNDDKDMKKINFYIDYLENIVNHLNSLQQNIFSLILGNKTIKNKLMYIPIDNYKIAPSVD